MKHRLAGKIAASVLAVTLVFGAAAPVSFAHCGHHSDSRVYCSYHHKTHKSRKSCSKYCPLHKATHKNGKKHHPRNGGGHHGGYY